MTSLAKSYDHVIVGAGVAAAGAVKGIRAVDAQASILVLGAEPDPPVYRPDLSKTLWLKEDAELASSALDLADADFRPGQIVTSLEPDAHRVTLTGETAVEYGRLLLATGAEPRTAKIAAGPRVVYYRTAADYRALKAVATPGSSVVVVGGGYIGSELASALAQNDVDVTLVIGGDDVQEGMFPRGLAQSITDDFTAHGVRIVHGRLADGEADDAAVTLRLVDGTVLSGHAAVIGIGVAPRVGLARAAGIDIDEDTGGVVVDAELHTSAPDVYAAGDIAAYPDVLLGRRRVEHVDAAETMGEAAGRIMAGSDEPYTHTPFFWSDLFAAGYEAIGVLDSSLQTVEDFTGDDYGTGVVYYLDSGRVVGVLLWNVWDSVRKAQAIMEESVQTPVTDPQSLRGRIPLG